MVRLTNAEAHSRSAEDSETEGEGAESEGDDDEREWEGEERSEWEEGPEEEVDPWRDKAWE